MKSDIQESIRQDSLERRFPDGVPYLGILTDAITRISDQFGISRLQAELTALEMKIIPERYVRNMKSFSISDQITLLKSEVSVIGLGGLGGAAAEMLARLGIGTLNLVDGDSFEETNLNRQCLSSPSLLGRSKAEAAVQRIRDINASVRVTAHSECLSGENAVSFIKGSAVVMDCLDNLPSRYVVQQASRSLKIPMVSAAIAGDTGHITVFYPEELGLEWIYGDTKESKGAEQHLGCLPYTAALMACLQCSEVVKILLRRGSILRKKLLIVDLLDNRFEMMTC